MHLKKSRALSEGMIAIVGIADLWAQSSVDGVILDLNSEKYNHHKLFRCKAIKMCNSRQILSIWVQFFSQEPVR